MKRKETKDKNDYDFHVFEVGIDKVFKNKI